MYSYHRLWLSALVLAILTTIMCGLANEVEISENLQHDDTHHHLEAQAAVAAASALQDITGTSDMDAGGDVSLELYRSLRFEPAQLDFGTWSVGTVRSHVVTLVNQNRNRSVYLSSVSGRSPAFYSSLFEAKTIPPNSNTTFNVVFLPRDQGAVSTSLHIHTSFGKLQLMVRGEGRECPYRLKPLVGIRAPLNATLMPEIHMYNPHGKALQILEVYSSGGQFQLELPTGNPEAPQGLWEIPPFTTKPVIRIRFQGFTAGNYSAYIRIKIAEPPNDDNGDGDNSSSSSSSSGAEEQVLVIPVEFEILPQYGLYAVNPLLEFGHIAVDDNTKPLKQKLYLRHSKSQLEQLNTLKFESITYIRGVVMADDDIISTVSIDPLDISEPVAQINEKLQLILKDTSAAYTYHNVELIVRAHIFKGSLHYNENATMFLDHRSPSWRCGESANGDCTGEESGSPSVPFDIETEKHIALRNDFKIPVAIYNVTTRPPTLQLKPCERIVVLQPGRSWDLLVAFRLAKQQQDLKDLIINYKTVIYVYTNITNFEIPIVISSTRLFVTTQTLPMWRLNNSVHTKELHLSSAAVRDVSNKGYIILQNRNLIPLKLKTWNCENPAGIYYTAQALGCILAGDIAKNNGAVDLERSEYKLCSHLYEGDICVFAVNLQPYMMELNPTYMKFETPYENITITIGLSIVMGKLEVDQEKLHFTNCFPGKLCSSELAIRSTFKQPIHMQHIDFNVPGLRFEDKNPLGSKIAPLTVTTVGVIYFEPSELCAPRCYIGRNEWAFPLINTGTFYNMPPIDVESLRHRIDLYRHFKYEFPHIDFIMTTKDMQQFNMNLMVEIQWPKLVMGRQVLPTIEANMSQVYEVKITNPSDQPILIDYSLADPTLAKQTEIPLPLEVIVLAPSCYLTDKDVFSLLVTQPTNELILIPALASIKVPIRFQSSEIGSFCTLLHVRNNLTLYEGIWISAKAVQTQFRLGNRKPGSPTPLLFEITEQQLALACPASQKRSESRLHQPQIVSRRIFTARNSGDLPIRIESFLVGDQPCQGYGFQIMDCSGFELKANSSKTIEIVFHSDFTVTRISKPLILKTNLSYEVSYTLVAQLPAKGLDQCNSLLARPPWEEKIRSAAIIMLVVTFVLVFIAVHIDYGNIMYQSSLYGARDRGQVHPTFNLRNIAMGTSSLSCSAEAPSATDSDVINQRNKTASLKKRNVGKNQKQSNGDVNSFAAVQNTMTLAEMVSWTFGSKTTKKHGKPPKTKESYTTDASKSSPTTTANETKVTATTKAKLNEKTILDKMDEDLKKSQNCKKIKVAEKPPIQSQEEKLSKEELAVEKDVKKDKAAKSPASKTTTTATVSHEDNISEAVQPKQQNYPLEGGNNNAYFMQLRGWPNKMKAPAPAPLKLFPMALVNQENTNAPKDSTNGRKLGKTPGRERRKQAAQNTSPATSSCSSASTSSSSCSLTHQTAPAVMSKRFERKSKPKASNSLKFTSHNQQTNSVFPSMTAESYMNDTSDQTFHPDVLSPWDYESHITFSDVLQQTARQRTISPVASLTSSPSSLLNTDLINHSSSLFEVMPLPATSSPPAPHHQTHSQFAPSFENAEITAALTPKRPTKPTANELGPIGSRKSPTSTPNWEPLNSAIKMQLSRPLNTTAITTSSTAPPLPYDHPLHDHYHYPAPQQLHRGQISPNFGYLDLTGGRQQQHAPQQLSPTQAQKQHDFDITAKLFEIQAHEELLCRRYMEQLMLHQQHQQYLNYIQAANNEWSSPQLSAASAWTPITANLFTNPYGADPSTTWSMASTSGATGALSSSSSSPGLMRSSPHGMEHNFVGQYLPTPSVSSPVATSATVATASHSSSSYNNNNHNMTTSNGLNGHDAAAVDDNMPMFNLFGGLSSIWNDNWKQSTTANQQQEQKEAQQHQPQEQEKQPPKVE